MADDASKTLWMGDLEPYMDEFFILQAFDQMGEPAVKVKMIQNKFSGTGEDDDYIKIYGDERRISERVGRRYPELRLPAGYCFVDFAGAENAQRAMLRLNGKIIPNSQPPHRFKLNCNTVRDNPKKEFSLFVGELSSDVDDYILFQAFSKRYTSCHSAKVVLDNRGVSKGYGFVRFTTETDQQKALIEMQHQTGIGSRQIRVSLATPKKSYEPPPGPPPMPYTNPSYPPHNQYNKMYDDYYTAYYQQYYANYYGNQYANQQQPPPQQQQQQQTTAAQYLSPQEDDSTALEEPELEVDVEKFNREYMAQSEEIFDLLEDSRWHPMDQWSSTVPATAR